MAGLLAGTALFLAGALALGDYIHGEVTGVAEVRVAARQFRAEASPYALHASSLVPGTDHLYRREDAEADGLRRFRTDGQGTVAGPEHIPIAEKTILFLGGSTTESNEVEEPNRFPAVVQELLRGVGLDVRTINAGVRGHTTQDSLMSYLARPGFRAAEIVVLMHNINDRLWLARFEDYAAPPSPSGVTSGAAVLDVGEAFIRATWDFVSYRSNLLFALRQRLTRFNPWTGEPRLEGVVSELTVDRGSDQAITHAGAFERNLRAFVSVVRSQGALPILMTQPLGHTSGGQDAFNDIVRRVAGEENAALIDVDAKLAGDRSWAFLGDGIHFNDAGSRNVGGIVAEALAPLLGTNFQAPALQQMVTTVPELLARCAPPPARIDDIQFSPARRILGMPGRYPSFSADGTWMVFQSWRGGIDRLQAYNVVSARIIDISRRDDPPVNERHPAVLRAGPDSLAIVFGSGFNPETDGFERLKVRHWPSMKTEDLIADPQLGGAIPAVAHDRIVFAGFGRSGRERVPDLMVLRFGDKTPRRLLQTPHEEWRPVIAPDGTVFFIANPKGQFDIFSLAPGATAPTLVFGSEADEWDPAVSPDGRWLAFASKRTGHWALMLLDRTSGVARTLTTGSHDDWDPSFHPDGRLIVFGRSAGSEPALYGVCAFGEATP